MLQSRSRFVLPGFVSGLVRITKTKLAITFPRQVLAERTKSKTRHPTHFEREAMKKLKRTIPFLALFVIAGCVPQQ